jgi:hypothetical protein
MKPEQQSPEERYEPPCAVDIDTDGGPDSVAAMVTLNSPPSDVN